MNASEAVYYPFPPTHEPPASTSNSKQCSVRGCTHPVADGSANKMCDVCRSRHRIYASTKRARRKLEKAAVANVVAARNRLESMVVDSAHKTDSIPTMIATPWGSENTESFKEELSVTNTNQEQSHTAISYPISTSPFANCSSIDPRLFTSNLATSSTQHVHLHQSSSSSELANALTLPLPRQEIPSKAVSAPRNDTTEQEGQAVEEKYSPVLTETASTDSSGASTRFCSVKGCKAVVPASYKFKMCPPCRTRYRTYGITKRAKWKSEREAFDHEMAGLRILEDKRRASQGLPPLADNPEELRAWELSILDEQTLEETSSQSLTPSMPTSPGPVDQAPIDPTISLGYISPNVIAGVYPATIGSIDTPYSVSPYSQAHLPYPFHSPMVSPLPLPARMCTVSHCHKILPGYYRFKRCEQHRLQNRHHSKLKRFREKVVKALGPEDGAMLLDSAVSGDNNDGVNSGDVDEDDSGSAERSGTSKGKGKEKATKILVLTTSNSLAGVPSPNHLTPAQQNPNTSTAPEARPKASPAKSREEMQKRSKFSCANDDCHNLLTPGVRWRTCDECRNQDRLRKLAARAELKAAERNGYRKDLTANLANANVDGNASAKSAREATTSTNSMSAMSTGSQGGANVIPEFTLPLNENGEEDAEGDPDLESAGEDPQTSQPQSHLQPPSEPQSAAQLQPQPGPEPPADISPFTNTNTNSIQKPTWKTPRVDELALHGHQRHPMHPHNSPTFNSLTKQAYAQAEDSSSVKGAFSKFRVELTSSLSWKPSPVYSGFLPKTKTGSSNLVQANRVATVSASTKGDRTVSSATEAMEDTGIETVKVTSNPQNGPQVVEVTTSNPLVPTNATQQPTTAGSSIPIANADKEPDKQLAPPPSQKKKVSAKGKKNSANNNASAIPASPLSALPTGFSPYGFPTSTYPYYPYFMPPFPYPAPPPTPITKNGTIIHPGPSSSSSPSLSQPHLPAPSHYFPYPFLPPPLPPHLAQAYGLGLGFLPSPYPYLPPRYTVPNQNSVSGQQPYPTIPPPPPGVYQGQPVLSPAPPTISPKASVATSARPSSSASSRISKPIGSSTATAQEGSSTSTSLEAKQDRPDPSTVAAAAAAEPTFTHYHEFLSYDSSLADPNRPVRKRRKVDPNYLEKYRAIHGFDPIASSSSSNVPRPEKSVDESLRGSMVDGAAVTTESSSSIGHSKTQSDDSPRLCARKTCQRTIPPVVAGTICEKCKLKFQKHQAKIRRKHKLEPQRLVITKQLGV